MIEKIFTWELGEHDPGSAQDGRTSSEMQSPGYGSLVHKEFSALNKANICSKLIEFIDFSHFSHTSSIHSRQENYLFLFLGERSLCAMSRPFASENTSKFTGVQASAFSR